MTGEDGDDHREALGVNPGRDPARHRQVRGGDQGLDLEQNRARPFERAGDRGADLAFRRATEELGRLGHADKTGAGHLEEAELVRRSEPVLGRPKDAVGVVAVALELEHAVDQVLEHARARDRAVLRDVPDQESRDLQLLRDSEEPSRGFTDLGHGPGR